MRPLIKWPLVAFLFIALSSSEGQAANIIAASCSTGAVQTAINSASNGDTVVIPNGSCTWTSGISTSKQITITGQTKGNVILTHNAGSGTLLALATGPSFSTVVSNLNFLVTGGTGNYLSIGGSVTDKVPLVHNNYFNLPDFQLLHAIHLMRNGAVVYQNTFESLTVRGSLGSGGAGSGALDIVSGDSTSWTTASTMGTGDTNGTANVYIEDNVFTNIYLQAIDCSENARTVIRHNTFNDSGFVCHGADTGIYGARHTEVYDNTFVFHASGVINGITYPLAMNWWFYVRGGTGVITGNAMPNIISQMWGNKSEVNFIVQQLHRNAGPNACTTVYPAFHQIGQSHNGTSLFREPLYIWGNSGTGFPESPAKSDYTPDECGHDYTTYTTANWVQSGRDYITGSAKPGWTRYTYPHPLRAPATPPAPSNLTIR